MLINIENIKSDDKNMPYSQRLFMLLPNMRMY